MAPKFTGGFKDLCNSTLMCLLDEIFLLTSDKVKALAADSWNNSLILFDDKDMVSRGEPRW